MDLLRHIIRTGATKKHLHVGMCLNLYPTHQKCLNKFKLDDGTLPYPMVITASHIHITTVLDGSSEFQDTRWKRSTLTLWQHIIGPFTNDYQQLPTATSAKLTHNFCGQFSIVTCCFMHTPLLLLCP